MRTRTFSITLALLIATALAGCTDGDDLPDDARSEAPPISPVESPDGGATPTPPALPDEPPPRRGEATLSCVNGWVRPPEDSPRFRQPLGIIRRTTGIEVPLEVVDIRYFEGPESPPSEQGYLQVVQRWYVKLYAPDDLSFQGRFLVEARRFGRGLAAVAPYDTNGFTSPDWIGFQYESEDLESLSYEGLPGTWAGRPYDFVEGGAGLTIPGLPEEVAGCLADT